jgi:demethylmenaquinone methyltransferase/2-methoxy-6-polyprenyl-1,4-benzoquinol methylase
MPTPERHESNQPGQYPPHVPLTEYYDEPIERQDYVQDLFNKSAHHYDTVEKIFFLNGGVVYRRMSLRFNGLKPGMKVLDVAVGTAAVSMGAVKIVGPTGKVFGVDPNPSMLREARKKVDIPLTRGVAQSLPFKSDYFDFVTMGIALRHVSDLKAAFSEYCRVLKPGGTLWILESHVPQKGIGHNLTKFVWKTVIPGLTMLSTGSRDAKELMDYYWDTIDQCVQPKTVVEAMQAGGFASARSKLVVPGAFIEYIGKKAER